MGEEIDDAMPPSSLQGESVSLWAITKRRHQPSGRVIYDFDDILAQIIDLLKRRGRVSYSALKRRFDLDDDYLKNLKDELLFAHPVVDEDNRGLSGLATQQADRQFPLNLLS